ncbi:SDR family NAD(P)-dependent oxidoreductase [Conexibacter sp. W3-3-2]|uniref:Short-chain dehydrogenase n=1 Tax=Paraconexibacter algicola TaxID=2133960 RepID=A0A2T4UEA6_9ACTN|nr:MULTISPECIES: short-chain dehydrogenase/reductase [Solirubrobacterales]MTD42957.1 SDR family NAD(P)-dependent oxidoreductase [Conexibacter sp. W3-3-2]PTL56113.1 short-chain dehydrogenase [Paraconexibacter algicola]
MASFDLSGKTALVTGAARGIGFATCERLVARGARVAVIDLDQEACDAAAARLGEGRAIGIAADVTDRGSMQQAVARTVEELGGVDVVVANAGIAHKGATFRALGTETFDRVIDVNLMGVVRTVEAALPQIVARRGHVVVVASVYAFVNGIGTTPYAMSKAGVEQFGRALRVELAQHGAGASVAYFGFIDTEMVHKALDADPLAERLLAAVPKPFLKRLPPKEAGEGIVRGIERRQPRIIYPRRWTAYSVARGIVNPLLDTLMVRDAKTQAVLRDLDARAGEEQQTTA